MSINSLVENIKENNQDFEFYPTTFEIVKKFVETINIKCEDIIHSILDIGCGNGNIFTKIEQVNLYYDCNLPYEERERRKLSKNYTKYGIEKSVILLNEIPDDIVIIGTDFHTQTLIDKKVDCIFCNPPYSEFETWIEKIILQGNSNYMFFVIPRRWKNNEKINGAIKKRGYIAETVDSFDFEKAERKARCKVDLVFISPEKVGRYNRGIKSPFDTWFDDTFSINADKQDLSWADAEKKRNEKINEIVASGDTAEMFVKFYNDDMEKLYGNYRKLESLDYELFKELNVDIKNLKEALQTRLKGLKLFYWDLLFKKYEKITSRLTTKGAEKVYKRLNDNTAIDFTLENIYQLTLWLIKHSNTLFDEQITEYFYSLCNTESIHRYKSNLRWNEDDWKYIKQELEKRSYVRKEKSEFLKNVMLDYRIVCKGYYNFNFGWGTCLSQECINFLYDTKVIAKNLGFDLSIVIPDKYNEINIEDWSNFDIYTMDGEVFANVKLYKNGNRHIKFCKEFMQKLNVEMARINKWVQNKEQAKEEFNLSEKEINEIWQCNKKIALTDSRKLLA